MKQFGGKLTDDLIARYEQSPNWKDGKFQNLIETNMEMTFRDMPKLLKKQFCDRDGREPKEPLPMVPFDIKKWEVANKTQVVWFGHSAALVKINGLNVVIDPMLGPNAAPIAPFAVKRYTPDVLDIIDDLPEIDLLLLTHDHYDHLDLTSMKKLIPKIKSYFVALGTARHLTSWGVPEETITEFDWWDTEKFNDLTITFTPSRHFSGRGLKDRAKSLWGGWAIKSGTENIYWSGDGGYGDHFKEVGERLGPFDFGFMECGQYNKLWHVIHMYPEEAVQAAIDAGAKKAMAVHWAGFSLALHAWKDPIERFSAEAVTKGLPTLYPKLGQIFNYEQILDDHWWSDIN